LRYTKHSRVHTLELSSKRRKVAIDSLVDAWSLRRSTICLFAKDIFQGQAKESKKGGAGKCRVSSTLVLNLSRNCVFKQWNVIPAVQSTGKAEDRYFVGLLGFVPLEE